MSEPENLGQDQTQLSLRIKIKGSNQMEELKRHPFIFTGFFFFFEHSDLIFIGMNAKAYYKLGCLKLHEVNFK